MKKEQLFIIMLISCFKLFAQSESDTSIVLPEVEISGSKAAHSPGIIINKIDSIHRLINQFNSVAELLSQYSTINIRSYGNGLLATINSRGSGANHTSINWNGIPLNSPNLGLTDLSLLPAFLFEEVLVVTGSTGSAYGNNSFGTAIELQNNLSSKNEIKISGMAGNYGTNSTNVKLNFANKNFASNIVLFQTQSKNNFEFKNTALHGEPVQKQINAFQQQTGFLQIINYNINNNALKAGIWYQFSEREIPPLMFSLRNDEVQKDSSFRVIGEWRKKIKNTILSNNLSYSREFIFYNNYSKNISGASDVKLYRNEIAISLYQIKNLTINSTFSGEIAIADIREYQHVKKNKRAGLNLNAKYNLSQNWAFGGGVKKEFTNLADSPLAFSLGFDGDLIKNILKISSAVSKVYSLPTLNDLYWKPGGNINLKPESGFSSQLNFTYSYFKESKLSITGFYFLINDWIQWIPNSSGIFSPVNIKQVESSGVEASVKQNFSANYWKFSLSGNYSLVKTINKAFDSNHELENKQLTFVPIHSANGFISIFYRKTGFYSNLEYTGERYITADNSSFLEDFVLVNSGFLFNYNYDRFAFLIKPEVKNIFDVNYKPIPWRAMPGRSYFLTISMNLNFK